MKTIIYQLLPRLFGNDNTNRIWNGTRKENGCGLLNNITLDALQAIKQLGVTYVWYTGLLEHATQTDYSSYGISRDHRAMVKGKAGSPYAIKDYYDIDPDLASEPSLRFGEFQELVRRTHSVDLKIVMDFVPNHVARQYRSDHHPKGVADLGKGDNLNKSFSPQNNFYYIPNTLLQCRFDMRSDEDAAFWELPAKATGNDCFSPFPGQTDWYETVKLNYGVDYQDNCSHHFDPIPSTWYKMRDILCFWTRQRIDAFRCDMSEMVPCEFWQWVIPQVKELNPEILFIGEVYNPALYHDYVFRGHFDYLYDKVGLYDTLRAVTVGTKWASDITKCWQSIEDIKNHMLNFLENHDEQRIASDFFAGKGEKGRAALVVSVCMGTNPFMLYFGQELGERGMDKEGFSGLDGRTSIFDYWSVQTVCQWRNKERYDGGQLSEESQKLRAFYVKVLQLATQEKALSEGQFFDLMYVNCNNSQFNASRTYAFIRSYNNQYIFIIVNFGDQPVSQSVKVPAHAFEFLGIKPGEYSANELLTDTRLTVSLWPDKTFDIRISPYNAVMLKICG